MLDSQQVAELDKFVRQYCAIVPGRDPQPGRFWFGTGKANRSARDVRQPLSWDGDPGAVVMAVVETVNNIFAESEDPFVFVRAYEYNATNPRAVLKLSNPTPAFGGALDDTPYPEDISPVAALVGAVVNTNRDLRGMVAEYSRKIEQHHQHQLQAVQTVTHLAVREGIADLSLRQAAIQATIHEVAQAVSPVVPVFAAAFAARMAGGDDSTLGGGPADKVVGLVNRIERSVGELGAVIQGAGGVPEGGEEAIGKLRAIVQAVAPSLGLQVSAT